MFKKIIFIVVIIALIVLGVFAYKYYHSFANNINIGSKNSINGKTDSGTYINDSLVDTNEEPDLGNLT